MRHDYAAVCVIRSKQAHCRSLAGSLIIIVLLHGCDGGVLWWQRKASQSCLMSMLHVHIAPSSTAPRHSKDAFDEPHYFVSKFTALLDRGDRIAFVSCTYSSLYC
eukprot:2717837-Pleurochrysis_carterae.AAC.1